MAVNAANLVMGPARLYVAPFGSTEPPDSAVTPNGFTTPPSAPWVDAGGTNGGVTYELDNTYTNLEVDQVTMAVGARLTEQKINVTVKMTEMTFANIQTALNNIAVTNSGTGYQTMEVPVGTSSTQPTYAALIVDGWAPQTATGGPALRRIIVRKVLSQAKAAFTFDKKTQQLMDINFTAFFVSNSINPVHIVDELT